MGRIIGEVVPSGECSFSDLGTPFECKLSEECFW